jgi:diphosphomevalonate decarboxylase
MKSTATANTNIAVIKYWGKHEALRNLPAVGSLSLTLDGIGTTTTVENADADGFTLGGEVADGARVFAFLDMLCHELGVKREPLRVTSVNTVPTAAGLASSASAFCALAAAATRAFGLALSSRELSAMARRGSASAARSVFGDFVELPASSGEEVFAEPLAQWDLRLVVARTSDKQKSVPSRSGMQHTAETSTYYPAWLASWRQDFDRGRAAIVSRDLTALGEAMEHSTMSFHATTMVARPPFLYWNGATVECIHAVWALRQSGTQAYWTADAGPHVKVLCAPADAERVAQTMRGVPGVIDVRTHAPGAGVTWS